MSYMTMIEVLCNCKNETFLDEPNHSHILKFLKKNYLTLPGNDALHQSLY